VSIGDDPVLNGYLEISEGKTREASDDLPPSTHCTPGRRRRFPHSMPANHESVRRTSVSMLKGFFLHEGSSFIDHQNSLG